jgi:hypothetical protein
MKAAGDNSRIIAADPEINGDLQPQGLLNSDCTPHVPTAAPGTHRLKGKGALKIQHVAHGQQLT